MNTIQYVCSGCNQPGPYGQICEDCDNDTCRFTVTSTSWRDRHAKILQPSSSHRPSLIDRDEQMRLAQEEPEPPFVPPPVLPPVGSTRQVLCARACAKCGKVFQGSPEKYQTIPQHYRNARWGGGRVQCVGLHHKPLPHYRTITEPPRPDTDPVPKATRSELARAYLEAFNWIQTSSTLSPRNRTELMARFGDTQAARHAAMLFSETLPEGKPWATSQELANDFLGYMPSHVTPQHPLHGLWQHLGVVLPNVLAEIDRRDINMRNSVAFNQLHSQK